MKKIFLIFNFTFLILNCLYCEHFIQAGVFRYKEEAVNQQLYLASRNYPVMLNINGHYRIIVGPYEDKETADFTVLKLLSDENISAGLINEILRQSSISKHDWDAT